LRASGLRITRQREAVLNVLADRPHLTAAQIASEVDGLLHKPLSRQGLYNVLGDLSRTGLLRCIEPAGSATRYELRVGDNHHHVVCRSCGRVEDVDCAAGYIPCLTAADDSDYEIDEAEVIYWGRCPECQSSERTNETEEDRRV
jgi:Fe2+ or Zn2+ uptake regulation protein